MSGDAEMSKSAGPSTVSAPDKANCWTVLHHLKYTENKSKISEEELEGLSKHVGNAVWPKDLAIVEETIEVHYPLLLRAVRDKMWSSMDEIPQLFNVEPVEV